MPDSINIGTILIMLPKALCSILLMVIGIAGNLEASEYLRLMVDLDGDKKPETITCATVGAGDWQHYTIKVGPASYSAEFFAVGGDLPQITLIRINYASGIRQILVTTFEAAGCNYEILSFFHGRVIQLMNHRSTNCEPPQSLGNGRIEVPVWEGFWNRMDLYVLDSQGTKLTREVKTLYPVEVPGVAAKAMTMKPAECSSMAISKGSYLMVKEYDPIIRRYLVYDLGNACGWVPEQEIAEAVKELPWAN